MSAVFSIAQPHRSAKHRLGWWACLFGVAMVVFAAGCTYDSLSASPRGVKEIGRQGRGPGRFSYPREVVIAASGEIYVIDKTGRIQRLQPDGTHLSTFEVPDASNGTPTGAAFDHDGNLLVADTHYSRILRFSADGTSMTQFGRYGDGPGELIYPTDVAVDGDGNIYVANYGRRDRIVKFRHDGSFVLEWGSTGDEPGRFRRPMGIAILNDEELVVADSCNHRIQRFDLNGKFLGMWGGVGREKGRLNYPYDVATGPDGKIYVAEYGNNRISKFSAKGRLLGVFGRPGNGLGQLRGPWSVALDRVGRLYVADTYNHRIQRIKSDAI